MSFIDTIRSQIIHDDMNSSMKKKGYEPLFTAGHGARIVIVGQAPGIRAQESMIPWDDKSGETLREWLGVTKEQFYDPDVISLLPMDFYYPGKGTTGDAPPRKGFAEKWHPQILQHMPDVELIILVGSYAQNYYLKDSKKKNLTETVRSYEDYLPKYFPIVHSSPLNFRWHAKNPWFKESVVKRLQEQVAAAIE